MPVVTIRGQLGSGAPEIGKWVAHKISAAFVDREMIGQVAAVLEKRKQEVSAKEMPPSGLLGRIAAALRGYGGDFTGVYLPTWEVPLDDTRYLAGLRFVIRELASSQSIVIRGRGSQFILRDYPSAFHVFTVAPLEVRVKRVTESMNLDEEAAKKEIARFDNSRREFIKKYFQAELEDPVYYDLVINTEHLSFESAASIVVDALPFKDRTVGGQAKTG